MQLGGSVSLPDNDPPACFVNEEGAIFLRGHVNLSPVPAVGGQLISILPRVGLTCPCTPETLPIIATTTALAVNPGTSPDVCIVRLQIARTVPADVNLDGIISDVDVNLVLSSPYFSSNSSAPSLCPVAGCGRVDVNQDGKVNVLDRTSIFGAVSAFPTPVPCGALYATAFSCGSTRSAPVTPALSISLDTLDYFNDDGLIISKRSGKNEQLEAIANNMDIVVSRVHDLETDLKTTVAGIQVHQATLQEQDKQFQSMATSSQQNRIATETEHSSMRVFNVVGVSVGVMAVAAALVALVVSFKRF